MNPTDMTLVLWKLLLATNYLSDINKLRQGGFGVVYKVKNRFK